MSILFLFQATDELLFSFSHFLCARVYCAINTKIAELSLRAQPLNFFRQIFFSEFRSQFFERNRKKQLCFAGTRVGVHYLPGTPQPFLFSAKSFSIETEVKNSNSQPINTNQDFKMVSAFVIGSLIIKTIKCHQFVDENMNMDSIRLLLIHILVLSGR